MAAKTLYSILDVERTAPAEEIKKAYRRLAQKYHPDRNPDDKQAEERFKEISVAHDILSDSRKRALYDEFGMDGLQPGFDPERARVFRQHGTATGGPRGFTWQRGAGPSAESSRSFADILNEMFSGLGRQARGVPGADVECAVEIGLLDAIRGRSVPIKLQQNVPCPVCRGTGRSEGRRCGRCHGAGVVRELVRISVKVPPGVDTGSRVRVAGKGEPGQFGGSPGDLYLILSVAEHPFLERRGRDLYLNLPITVGEAVSGATVTVPTPSGKVRLKIPAGSQSGKMLRLRGAGVSDRRNQDRGDLFVRLLIHIPANGADRIQEAVETLERAYGGDLRRHIRL